MRQRRSPNTSENAIPVECVSITDDGKHKNVKSKAGSHNLKTCKSFECVVSFVLLLITIIICIALFLVDGHFILCWLNVGMCTPLMDVARIAYHLSINASASILSDIDSNINTLEMNIDHICESSITTADFKLVLVIISSSQQFEPSNIFTTYSGVYLDSDVVDDKSLQHIYTKYSFWSQQQQDDNIYVKVLYLKSLDIDHKYIYCHQIGVVWLLRFDDITDNENMQLMINNMTFYKQGGIRHSIFYLEQLQGSNKKKYLSMLSDFLQI